MPAGKWTWVSTTKELQHRPTGACWKLSKMCGMPFPDFEVDFNAGNFDLGCGHLRVVCYAHKISTDEDFGGWDGFRVAVTGIQ